MKRIFLLLVILTLPALPARAAVDPVQKAMKAYERHRYEDAGSTLRAALPSLGQARQNTAYLTLGMIYLKNAELHADLADLSARVNADYLKRLARERGRSRSRYCTLYLGLALLDGGDPRSAETQLARFRSTRAAAKYKDIANIALGTAAFRRGSRAKAENIWRGVASADPDVRTALAAAFSTAGLTAKHPEALCDGALAEARKHGRPVSLIAEANCLGVYGRAGATDKGFDLLGKADLKSYFYRESIGKSKVISFYDVSLLSNLSAFYLRAAVEALERASADPQLMGIAAYYLGEAQERAGEYDRSVRATALFLASPQLPPQYRNRALVRQGAIRHRQGKQSEALGLWDDLMRKQPGDPELLADILTACSRLRIACPRAVQVATAAAERGEGRRFAIVNVGLGDYYLSRKDYARAVTFLEAGRDKGNKNKIESNDPDTLISLSEAYYRTKKYSEALEIYFEMSKEFPEVRQLQEALQGIYSMEHRSAGDVKIY